MSLRTRCWVVSLFVLISAGCGADRQEPVEQASVVPPAEGQSATDKSVLPSPVPSEPQQEPTAPPTAEAVLYEEGHWLVFPGMAKQYGIGDSIWVLNGDGSAPQPVIENELIINLPRLADGVAANGGHVAYITADDAEVHRSRLRMFTLPDTTVQTITRLTSDAVEDAVSLVTDNPNIGVLSAIASGGMAWSPDGTRLAFIGAMEGPSADLYVYSVADQSITRLSSGPGQAVWPSWSPDGRYIVHFERAVDRQMLEGVWAVDTTTGEVIFLYAPTRDFEVVLLWADNETFLVASGSQDCPRENLRLWNIRGGLQRTLWEGCYLDAAAEPYGMVVLSAGEYYLEDEGSGLYFLEDFRNPQDSFTYIHDEHGTDVEWMWQFPKFVVRGTDHVINVDPAGYAAPTGFPVAALPEASLSGRWLAVTGTTPGGEEGIWTEDSEGVYQIADEAASAMAWGDSVREGQSHEPEFIFYFGQEGLYRYNHTDKEGPELILPGVWSFYPQSFVQVYPENREIISLP